MSVAIVSSCMQCSAGKAKKTRRKRKMAEEGVVIVVNTVDSWNEHIQKGKDSNKLIVVDFTASWCGPCRLIAPVLAKIAQETPQVIFLKVDVDEFESLVKEWSIKAMPTILFLKDGEEVDRIVGAKSSELISAIRKHETVAAA